MSRDDIFEKIKSIISDLIFDYSIEYPIDSYHLAHKFGINTKQYADLSPVSKISDDGFSFEKGGSFYICFNNNKKYARINFTIMHEIGHYILHSFLEENRISDIEQEQYCNFFAKYFLAPLPLVAQLEEISEDAIANHFKISYECACNVLESYNKRCQYGVNKWTDYELQIFASQIKPTNTIRNETKKTWVSPKLIKGATFTIHDEYPIISPYGTSDSLPKKIIPFEKYKEVENCIDEYFICFYSDDKTFRKVADNPDKYLNLFSRSAGIIGFDFSVFDNMPKIEQQYTIFINQALSYYFTRKGIPLIPNIRYGNVEFIGDYFDSIPRNIYISIGTHGQIQTKGQKEEWRKCLNLIVEKLDPECIVVYGPHPEDVFGNFERIGVKFCYIDPWRPPLHRKSSEKGSNIATDSIFYID